MSGLQEAPAQGNTRRNLWVAAGLAVVLIGVGGVLLQMFYFGIQPGPSFVDQLQSGKILPQDVSRVDILKNAGTTWPFTEQDYAALPRVTVSKQSEVDALVSALAASAAGRQFHNHPGKLHGGILRVDVHSGEHYYIFYAVYGDAGGVFTDIKANSANSTNPNGAETFENVGIVSWIRSNDPWYPASAASPVPMPFPSPLPSTK